MRNHPYFASIDWARLAAKAVTPDFKPTIDDAFDSGNFKQRGDYFEKTIEPDNASINHEPWAQDF